MKKNMKRLNSYTLIATALLSLAACNRGDGDFDATGTFEATEILVSSEANGKIMELNIEEGDRLDAGALVGYVDSTQLYLKKCNSRPVCALSISVNRIFASKLPPWSNRLLPPVRNNNVWRIW